MAQKKTTTTPTKPAQPVMSYERSFEVTDCRMTSVLPDGTREPVRIREQSGRCTKNYVQTEKAATDTSNETANLFRVEVAMLNPEADRLDLDFSWTVLPSALKQHASSNIAITKKLDEWVAGKKDRLNELAFLYAQNLASGAWLWRNRNIAYQVKISVTDTLNKKEWSFVPLSVIDPKKDAPDAELMGDLREIHEFEASPTKDKLIELSSVIANALAGTAPKASLAVHAEILTQKGAEVYPSQEMVPKSGNDKHGVTKILARIQGDDAGIHARKVSNALRTIDKWYAGADDLGPISVEFFGGSLRFLQNFRSSGTVYSPSASNGVYAILQQCLMDNAAITSDEELFLLACLVRGGLFTATTGDDKKETAAESNTESES